MIGTKLAHYEITSHLGSGGMGDVYQATDVKLGRKVAIKLLPEAFAQDTERATRFEREARVLASVNHPSIAAIYGIEQSGERKFLVMELVPGETLAERIQRGPIPIDDALGIAKQIADALESAHEKGIIHRDLKPANVKITPDGNVKVLDFGLAKAFAAGTSDADFHNSPTLSMAATNAGIILGTAAYMSPEQARGMTLDRRTDIFSFGAVVFEILTGRPAFKGDSLSDILASVLKSDPDWNLLPDGTPNAIQRLLRKCLHKDARRRLQHIGDARVEIEDFIANPPQENETVVPPQPRRRIILMLATALVAVVIGAGSASIWFGTVRSMPRVFQVESGDTLSAPQVSANGRAVAFIRNRRVAVRPLDSTETEELQGTDGASNPFWSPDGQSIAFFVGRQLRAVSARGGASRVLSSSAFAPYGGTWCPRGIVFGNQGQGLWLVPDGGQAEQFAALDRAGGETALTFPHCLPDGSVLAIVRRNMAEQSLVLIAENRRTVLLDVRDEQLSWPVFAAPDSVLFQRQGANTGIWRIEVSKDLTAASGVPVTVLANGSYPSVSADGMLIAMSGVRQEDRQLVWVDRTGRQISEFGKPRRDFPGLAVSPDGHSVAAPSSPGTAGSDIWIQQSTTAQPLPLKTLNNRTPAWSRSGNLIAYAGSTPDGDGGLFVGPASGIGDVRLIVKLESFGNFSPAWSPNGRSLVYQDETGLWLVSTDPGSSPRRLLENAAHPAVSPDGRLLAYTADAAGRTEIYVTTFPVPGAVWPVSGDGGRHPRWNPRGGELFYATGPNVGDDPNSSRDLSVVKVDVLPSIKIGQSETLFDAEALGFRTNVGGSRGYDVGPDGQRFVLQTTGMKGTPTITVIQNLQAWMARPH